MFSFSLFQIISSYCYQDVHIYFSIIAMIMVGLFSEYTFQHSWHSLTFTETQHLTLLKFVPHFSLLFYTPRWKGLSCPDFLLFHQPCLFSNQITWWLMSNSCSNDLKIMDPTQHHFCYLHTWKSQRNVSLWVLTLKTQPTVFVISQSFSCCL